MADSNYSREAIQQRAQERKTQRALDNAYSSMSDADAAASKQYYADEAAKISGGTGTDAEKAAALAQLTQTQIANPYATGDSAYDQYANSMLAGYNEAKKAQGNAYGAAEDALTKQLEQALAEIERQRPEVEQSYQDAQRQAYVQQMQAKKNLGQQLAAQGLTGGASESAMLNLENNYGNQRTAYTRDRDSALRQLDYAANDAQTQAAIQSANLEAQYEQALAEIANSYWGNIANAKLQSQMAADQNALAAQQWEQELAQQQWENDFAVRQLEAQLEQQAWENDYAMKKLNSGTGTGSSTAGLNSYLQQLQQMQQLGGGDDDEGSEGGTTVGLTAAQSAMADQIRNAQTLNGASTSDVISMIANSSLSSNDKAALLEYYGIPMTTYRDVVSKL